VLAGVVALTGPDNQVVTAFYLDLNIVVKPVVVQGLRTIEEIVLMP
jgi:hypothetical protein